MTARVTPAQSGLQAIHGRELSSVEFVRDYLQLRFDGPCLSAYTMPVVRSRERVFRRLEQGYADALVALVGQRVEKVAEDAASVTITFSDETAISISLASDRVTAEAATLTTDGSAIWSW